MLWSTGNVLWTTKLYPTPLAWRWLPSKGIKLLLMKSEFYANTTLFTHNTKLQMTDASVQCCFAEQDKEARRVHPQSLWKKHSATLTPTRNSLICICKVLTRSHQKAIIDHYASYLKFRKYKIYNKFFCAYFNVMSWVSWWQISTLKLAFVFLLSAYQFK